MDVNQTKFRHFLAGSVFLLIFLIITQTQARSTGWDDEPDELSWEHFSSCQFCFDDFKGWWENLPEDRQQNVLTAADTAGLRKAPPDALQSMWIQAESFMGPDWTQSEVGGRTTLKGPLGHNTAIAKTILTIPVEGTYRLWSHWWNVPGYHNSFEVKIRPIETKDFQFTWQTSAEANYLEHRFAFAWYERPSPAPVSYDLDHNGFQWESSLLFHLPKGQVVIEMTPTIHTGPYTHRDVDCFLLTQDPFLTPQQADIPDSNPDEPGSLITTQKNASDGSVADWQLWSIRPAAIPVNQAPAAMATMWNDWRNQLIDRLAKEKSTTPHEKVLEHNFYFDSRWNLIGTPAQIAKEAARQKGFTGYFEWLEAEKFESSKGWESVVDVRAGQGKTLQASYGDGEAEASTTIHVPQSGKHRLWVRWARLAEHYNHFTVKVQQGNQPVQETNFHEIGPATAAGYTYFWQPVDIELEEGPCTISLTKNIGKSNYAYRKVDCLVVTDNMSWEPDWLQRPAPAKIPEALVKAVDALPQGSALAWFAETPDHWTGFTMTDWPETPDQIVGASPISIEVQPGAVQSAVLHLTNPSSQPITVTPKIPAGANLLNWRLAGYQFSPGFGWQPMPLLKRSEVTIPPHLTASLWLSFDARNLAAGEKIETLDLGTQQLAFKINITGTDIRHAKAPIVGGWCAPWPSPEGWQTFTEIGLNVVHQKVLPKAQMEKFQIALCNVTLGIPKSADEVREMVATMESMGLEYGDWSWEIMDEPSASTYEEWIEAAKIIRHADPRIRIWSNPGWIGASTPESVTAMTPWIDVFCPYTDHFDAKDSAYLKLLTSTGNPKLIYTTPCYNEKSPAAPLELLQMADLALEHNRDGWDAFSLLHDFPYAASAWDEANAMVPDQSVSIYPGAWKHVMGSRNLEAVRQAIQNWKTATVQEAEKRPREKEQ